MLSEPTWLLSRWLSCGPLPLICFGLHAHWVMFRPCRRAARLGIRRCTVVCRSFCHACSSCCCCGFLCPSSCSCRLRSCLCHTLLFPVPLQRIIKLLSFQNLQQSLSQYWAHGQLLPLLQLPLPRELRLLPCSRLCSHFS